MSEAALDETLNGSSDTIDSYGPVRAWYALTIFVLQVLISGIYLTFPTLIVHQLETAFHMDDVGFAGITAIPYAIGVAVVYYPSGLLTDTFPRRYIIIAGTALWITSAFIAARANSGNAFFLAILLAGIGTGVPGPAIFSIITDGFSRTRRAFAISVYTAINSVSVAVIFIACGAMVDAAKRIGTIHIWQMVIVPWQQCFVASGIMGLVILGLVFTIPEPPRKERVAQTRPSLKSTLLIFRQYLRKHWLLWVLLLVGDQVAVTSLYGLGQWAPAFGLRNYGAGGTSGLALLGIFSAAGCLVGSICGGLLAQNSINHGNARLLPRLLVMATLIGCVFAVAFPFMPSWTLALVGIAGVNATMVAVGVLLSVGIQETAPNEARGQLLGLLGFLTFFPTIAGASLVAFLASNVFAKTGGLGPALAVVGGITSVIGLVLFAFSAIPYEQARDEMRELVASQPITEV